MTNRVIADETDGDRRFTTGDILVGSGMPLLGKLALTEVADARKPEIGYDTISETSTHDRSDETITTWATGTYITHAKLDPSRDEQTDR